MQWLVILIALGAGALAPLQGTNAELFKFWQQPIWTTIWVYLSGLAAILLVQGLFRQQLPTHYAVSSAPWWAYMGGILSIVTTLVALMFAQKLGSGMLPASASPPPSSSASCSIRWAGSALSSTLPRLSACSAPHSSSAAYGSSPASNPGLQST